jgi:hypothetical protein
MKTVVFIHLLLSVGLKAQDKIFFKSGQVANGKFVSWFDDQLSFIYQDSINTTFIHKKEILIIELTNGERYLIGEEKKNAPLNRLDTASSETAQNAFGMQPFGIFLGRITFVYERFLASGKLGIAVPISITFDPFGVFYRSADDTSSDAPEHIPGIGYIAGLDLNYYFNERSGTRFFMGPRLRYGTDKLLRGAEGFSIQYQLGWHLQSGKNFSQHISIGYGFVKILNVPSSSTLNPEQLYGWLSLNYRISLLK